MSDTFDDVELPPHVSPLSPRSEKARDRDKDRLWPRVVYAAKIVVATATVIFATAKALHIRMPWEIVAEHERRIYHQEMLTDTILRAINGFERVQCLSLTRYQASYAGRCDRPNERTGDEIPAPPSMRARP